MCAEFSPLASARNAPFYPLHRFAKHRVLFHNRLIHKGGWAQIRTTSSAPRLPWQTRGDIGVSAWAALFGPQSCLGLFGLFRGRPISLPVLVCLPGAMRLSPCMVRALEESGLSFSEVVDEILQQRCRGEGGFAEWERFFLFV